MSKLIGVIMAAGMGRRLNGLTKEKPKALIPVRGKELIKYNIDFMRGLGAKKIIVIGGFYFDNLQMVVKDYAPEATILRNGEYQKGNLFTFLHALEILNDDFILSNTDHIYRKSLSEIIKTICMGDNIVAFCDNDRKLEEDDMKVFERGGCVSDISKQLQEFNWGYVGLTYCPKTKLVDYKYMIDNVIREFGEKAVVENVLKYLSKKFIVKVGDISGHGWLEIDTRKELRKAEKEISQNYDAYI
ncbi:NTP transferase domain-containing protein [Patescibacteria group bacterium]|nr:NTP transferase domain-containing protein [Patescibacteria group bacterium]